MNSERTDRIIQYVREHPGVSSSEITSGLGLAISSATLRRELARLISENKLTAEGQNKGTRYFVSPAYDLFAPIDVEYYFSREIDQRKIIDHFNFELFGVLAKAPLFTRAEHERLTGLQQRFRDNVVKLTPSQYKKELERLAVDLSWKSSQIEGNTYSLLETERLLLEKETASGKTLEEATMLLNHKEALDYIIENPHYLQPLSIAKIENIHSILIQDLGVDKNIRTRRVGITGTNYRPLDNEFQIREALEDVCDSVNRRDDIFEKALLLLILISYIQPFNDGNKRTARIVSNAELMAHAMKYAQCRLSVPTLDQVAAAALYDVGPEYFAAVREEYKRRRDTVMQKLQAIPGVVCECPKGAFYVMAALPVDDADVFQRWLLEEFQDNGDTVMFAPGEPFYATPGRGRSEIRIAYVLKQEDLERAMDLLALGIRAYNAR